MNENTQMKYVIVILVLTVHILLFFYYYYLFRLSLAVWNIVLSICNDKCHFVRIMAGSRSEWKWLKYVLE